MKKEMKIQIAIVTACSLTAWVALVALFVLSSEMDTLGVAVLTLVLMAFVGVGVGSLVEEYKNDQYNELGRDTFDTIAELCTEIDELRLARDGKNRAVNTRIQSLQATLRLARAENAEQLEEIYNLKASIADLTREQNERIIF